LWVRREFIDKNPKTIAAMVRAINKGTKDAIANPRAAAQMMTKYNSLLNVDTEHQRLLMALEHHLSDDSRKHGLSYVDPARMKSTIDMVVKVQNFERTPTLETTWTDKFLPPQAERMPPALGK
jgi:NitT/TauT family transport system substrate-binding protein